MRATGRFEAVGQGLVGLEEGERGDAGRQQQIGDILRAEVRHEISVRAEDVIGPLDPVHVG